MSMDFEKSSYEGDLPNREPQAPRSISIADAEREATSARDDIPYNKGGEGHGYQGNPPE